MALSSINTNFAALTALESLRQTNRELSATQGRISTGREVETAGDNAAYWSMATTLRSDRKSISAVADALGLGAATIDTAYTAMDSSIRVVTDLKAKLVAAREPGVDRTKIQAEIDQLQDQLRSIAKSASFSGENWLYIDIESRGYTDVESVVASFARSYGANGSETAIGTIEIDVTKTFLFNKNTDGVGGGFDSGIATSDKLGILGSARMTRQVSDDNLQPRGSIKAPDGTIVIASAFGADERPGVSTAPDEIDVSSASDADIEDYIQAVDAALADMTDAATKLGSSTRRIDMQRAFVSTLMDTIERGVSILVDADMSVESTRLQALQVRQQLGVEALSIANATNQNILALFK